MWSKCQLSLLNINLNVTILRKLKMCWDDYQLEQKNSWHTTQDAERRGKNRHNCGEHVVYNGFNEERMYENETTTYNDRQYHFLSWICMISSLITSSSQRMFLCHAKHVFSTHLCKNKPNEIHNWSRRSNYKVKCITLKSHYEAVQNLNNHAIQQVILSQQSFSREIHWEYSKLLISS